jgi:hypothetical protein
MIEWPDEKTWLTSDADQARKALDLFKKTSFAADLADDPHKWHFRAFARSPAPPARMVLHSDGGATRIFTLERTGFWRQVADQDAF